MSKSLWRLFVALVCTSSLAAFEIESGKLDPAMAAPVGKPEASGGTAVRLIAPAGTKLPVADVKILPGPAVRLEFSVDKPGMYEIMLRAFTLNDGSDSVWCSIDGAPPIPFWFRREDHGKWAERPALHPVELIPGKHELAFYVRENGILLDKADIKFKGAIKRRTIALTGSSPYRFTVKTGGEYQLRSVCASESRDVALYGTFAFDGKTPYRRVVFAASGRKVRSERLMHITLAPGEHTLEVKLPENVELKSLALVPVDRDVPAPPEMLAYQPPFSPVKGEHPRLLMRKSNLPRIRANFASPENEPIWAMVRARAKENPAIPVRDGQVYHNVRYLTILNSKAFVYAVEGDETVGREAVRGITGYLAKIDFDNLQDVTRKIGHTIYITSLIYDWCYPLLSEADKTVLRQAMIRLGRDQEIGWPPLRQSVINGHGNESQLSRDFLAMAIAVYDEDPVPWKICSYRILEEMVPAHNYEYPSGRHTQGTNYGPCRFRWDLHALLTLERLSGKRVFAKDIEKVPFYWINMMLPNQELFDDTDVWIQKGQPFRYPETFFNMYVVTGDPLIKAEFLRQGGAGWARTDPIFFLLFNRPEVVAKADFAKLPLTWRANEPLPSLVARSSWAFGKDSPAAVVEMKGAMYHRHDHQHMDAGAFQVYFRAPLLVDIGQYGHWGGYYDFHFAKRTIPHNCMLFYDPDEKFAVPGNDGGQRFVRVMPRSIKQVFDHPEIHRTGKTLAVSIGPNRQFPMYSHLKSDLAAAYSAHKLSAYTRSFVYANTGDPDKPAILIVFDRTKTTKPEYKKFFVLNSPVKPEIRGNVFTYRNRLPNGPEGAAVVTSLLPEKETVECKSGGQAMEFFREKVEAPPKNRELSKGSRTMISPAKPALADEFLHVVEVGAPEAVRATAQLKNDGNRLYVTAANWLVGFAHNPDDRAIFRVKDARNVLITDLEPGTYTVTRNGQPLQSQEVKAGEGTLFFPAEPGDYRIARGDGAPKADYSGLKAAVPTHHAQIELDGKPLAITPEKFVAARFWPVEQACRALGGEAKLSGDRATLKLATGTFAVRVGSAEAKDGKFSVRLAAEAKMLNGKLCLLDESLAALAGYVLRRDGENARLRKLPDGIIGVVVSGEGDGSIFMPLVPEMEADYWGIEGGDHAYTVYFQTERALSGADVAWFRGTTRRAKFAVETSRDGVKFAPVWKGESSGKSDQYEPVKFAPVRCRAVRLHFFGNSENDWNSIRRVRFRCEK